MKPRRGEFGARSDRGAPGAASGALTEAPANIDQALGLTQESFGMLGNRDHAFMTLGRPERDQAKPGARGAAYRRTAMAVALAVGGCAKSPFPVIDAKMDALKGQPIKAVVDKLGEPTEQSPAGAQKLYVWALESNFDRAYQAVGFACTIRVFVGVDGKVARYAYDGNVGGCGRYAHELDESYHTAQGIVPDF